MIKIEMPENPLILEGVAVGLNAIAVRLRVDQAEQATPAAPTEQATPAAPTEQAAPAAPTEQAARVEVDKTGRPWDARIDVGTKTKTLKGLWKRKKGLEDAEYDAVVSELMSTPAPAAPTEQAAPAAPVGVMTFATLLGKLPALGLTSDQVEEKIKPIGLMNLAELATKPHLIPTVAELFGLA